MNFKFLLMILPFVLSLNTFASLDKEKLLETIKGRYILQTIESGEIQFLIRTSGKLEVIKSDWYDLGQAGEGYPSKFAIEQGDNGLFKGMPVAHLIFSEGSDEQALDYHIILTAQNDWASRGPVIRLLSSFALENDGPNELASIISTKLTLLKYSVKLKKFVLVK